MERRQVSRAQFLLSESLGAVGKRQALVGRWAAQYWAEQYWAAPSRASTKTAHFTSGTCPVVRHITAHRQGISSSKRDWYNELK